MPVLTCPGERWVARVCGSILNALKMNDLITKDMAEYEEKAVFLATHPEELKKIKEKLAQSKKEGNFFNSKAYAEKFAQICLDLVDSYKQ